MAKLGKNDLEKIMRTLSKRRPVFHSEADFQHELAFELREHLKDAKVRLEYPQKSIKEEGKKRKYIDIVVFFDDEVIGIEVKYALKGMNKNNNKKDTLISVDNDKIKNPENFYVSGQGGQNKRGFAFIEDIHKLENFEIIGENHKFKNKGCLYGYLIILTNDATYSKKARSKKAKCAKYKFYEGAILKGDFKYGKKAIELEKEHVVDKWNEYNAKDSNIQNFKYLIVEIEKTEKTLQKASQ